MSLSEIKEIRILPPIAIARSGSATLPDPVAGEVPGPMDNYEVVTQGPRQWRKLFRSETLRVGYESDAFEAFVAEAILPNESEEPQFRGAGDKIRPVAPFHEVWALIGEDENLKPLTKRTPGSGLDTVGRERRKPVRPDLRVARGAPGRSSPSPSLFIFVGRIKSASRGSLALTHHPEEGNRGCIDTG